MYLVGGWVVEAGDRESAYFSAENASFWVWGRRYSEVRVGTVRTLSGFGM